MLISEEAFTSRPISCRVIDAHTHLGAYHLHGWHQKHNESDTEAVLRNNERLGIDCIVTTPHQITIELMEQANMISEKATKDFPNKIYAYIAIVPSRGFETIKRELEKYSKNKAFLGLKFLPGYYHGALTASEYQYAMDFANEMSCPLLCHVWGKDPKHEDIAAALKTRHNMKFIMAHQGGGSAKYTRIAADIVNNYENAYIELCGSMDNQFGVEDIVEMTSENKVIFGTDAINLDPKYELGRVALSPLSDDIKRKIFAENYLEILKTSHMGKIL